MADNKTGGDGASQVLFLLHLAQSGGKVSGVYYSYFRVMQCMLSYILDQQTGNPDVDII